MPLLPQKVCELLHAHDFWSFRPIRFSFYVSHSGTTYSVSHYFNHTRPLSHLDNFRSFQIRQFELILTYYLVTLSTSWRPRTRSPNSARIWMEFPLPSRIAHAHLLVINMDGTKQYLRSVARCTMPWRPIDPSGTHPEYRLRHLRLLRSQHAHHGLHLRHLFRPHRLRAHRHLPTTPTLHLNATLLHRDHRDLCHPREQVLLSTKDIHADQLKSHQWSTGNLMSTSTTPTRSMVWISPPESARADFQATRTLKGWILYKSHSGSSCTRACTYTWLRRVAYGRETFVLPFDNIGTTVFVAGIGITTTHPQCRLGQTCYLSGSFSRPMSQPEGSYPKHGQRRCSTSPILAPDSTLCGRGKPTTHSWTGGRIGQGKIGRYYYLTRYGTSGLYSGHDTDGRALQGQPAASTTFDPSTLLISPGLREHLARWQSTHIIVGHQYTKWVKALKLPQPKQDILEKNLEKVNEWWQNQPDDASKTIQRASVAMGIDPCKHKGPPRMKSSSRSWLWRYWCTPD